MTVGDSGKFLRQRTEATLVHRFLRAVLLTTLFYSSLLFCYLIIRVVVNGAPINSPFIDYLLPWFTFIRLGTLTLAVMLLSIVAYLSLLQWEKSRSRHHGFDENA